MPAYTFDIKNRRTGETLGELTLNLPIIDRGEIECVRRTVPERLRVTGSAKGVPTQSEAQLAGYYRKEEREGSRFKSEFTKAEIKKAWATPAS